MIVSGPAGVGKSRLGWEFEKYVDGLAENVYWHRGRCLPYGEDMAFWALAEIVRARLGIADEDAPSPIEDKLARMLAELFDDEDRGYVAPDGAGCSACLEPASRAAPSRAVRRLAALLRAAGRHQPVLLLIEDRSTPTSACSTSSSTWSTGAATSGCSSSRSPGPSWWPPPGHRHRAAPHPARARARSPRRHARPARRPGAAAARRGGAAIAAQAEGIPLYAVETVRSLIDRDVWSSRARALHAGRRRR